MLLDSNNKLYDLYFNEQVQNNLYDVLINNFNNDKFNVGSDINYKETRFIFRKNNSTPIPKNGVLQFRIINIHNNSDT